MKKFLEIFGLITIKRHEYLNDQNKCHFSRGWDYALERSSYVEDLRNKVKEAVEIFKDIKATDYVDRNHQMMKEYVKEITGEDLGDY